MTALMLNKRKRSSDAVSESGTCQTEQTEASTPRREVDEKYGVVCGAALARLLHFRLQQMHLTQNYDLPCRSKVLAQKREQHAEVKLQVPGLACITPSKQHRQNYSLLALACILLQALLLSCSSLSRVTRTLLTCQHV